MVSIINGFSHLWRWNDFKVGNYICDVLGRKKTTPIASCTLSVHLLEVRRNNGCRNVGASARYFTLYFVHFEMSAYAGLVILALSDFLQVEVAVSLVRPRRTRRSKQFQGL